ncbi:MAG: hypothetical protein LUH36_01150 [Oscillospiraceae bacterium]|nr:hypothetical protein [Oscillospiraceae bacterium]
MPKNDSGWRAFLEKIKTIFSEKPPEKAETKEFRPMDEFQNGIDNV